MRICSVISSGFSSMISAPRRVSLAKFFISVLHFDASSAPLKVDSYYVSAYDV